MVVVLGVVVGGLLTAGMTALLDAVRRRREARASALILADELREAMACLEASAMIGVWAAVPRQVLSSQPWREHRGALARIKCAAWYPATSAFMSIEKTARLADEQGAVKGTELPDADSPLGGTIELAAMQIDIAITALGEYARQPFFKGDREAVMRLQERIAQAQGVERS